jgi:sugar diacid utilization regulator
MLGTRVAALGLRFNEGLRLDVIRLSQTQLAQTDLEEIAATVSARLEQVSTQHLLSARNREVVILSAPDGKLELLMKELVASNDALRVGVGRPVSTPEDARTSWRDAQLAVQHLALHRSSGLLVFEDLDLITQILAEVPAERVGSRLANMAEELRKQPIQLEALRAYFSYDRDIRAAAAAIYLHPNTLRYRLERFEAAFGRSLQEPSTIASIYCLLTLMSDEDA